MIGSPEKGSRLGAVVATTFALAVAVGFPGTPLAPLPFALACFPCPLVALASAVAVALALAAAPFALAPFAPAFELVVASGLVPRATGAVAAPPAEDEGAVAFAVGFAVVACCGSPAFSPERALVALAGGVSARCV